MLNRLEDRWKNRSRDAASQQALVTVTVCEEVAIADVAPDVVWQLVWNPATSPLVLDNVLAAFTVPGTPSGKVGEMQMHIVKGPGETLTGTIEEVVELGPGYRAVTRSRSTALPCTSTTLILPLDQGGCVLRHSTQLTVAATAANAAREETQAHTQRYLSRVRDLAEASLQRPGPGAGQHL